MEKSVHMHTDDFYHYLSKGAILPHLPESNEQNLIVIEAFLEAAKRYARGGYDVIVDGIIGPWFLQPWLNIVHEGYEVHYIILRATMCSTPFPQRTGASPKRWKRGGRHGLTFATPSLLKKALTAASTTAALPVRA